MIYLSGRFCKNKNIGLMLSFNANHTTKNMIKTFKVIGIDNGCYSKPEKYDDELYLQYLNKLDFRDSLFATAPDVVGDYKLTRKRSYPMFKKIRDIGYKVAYVGQDGEDGTDLDFTLFDCLFIGGTTEWKLSQEAYKLIRLAKQHGKWIHMGRVNSFKRMRVAGAIGVDSVDGTYICWDTDYRINQLNEWLKNVNNQYYLGLN